MAPRLVRLASLPLLLSFAARPAIAETAGTGGLTERERAFLAVPDPSRIRATMKALSAHPHPVGSPFGKEVAETLRARLEEWGFAATIERFDVLFPTPTRRALTLISPHPFTASLTERRLSPDDRDEPLPPYVAFSPDGDVTAPLVYVNHGMPSDYETLERLGVSVQGAIVIARLGGGWRGIKPKLAAAHGAIGCILYADPKDDGYAAGVVYPGGPMRPRDAVERGSILDGASSAPGDPLTPGAAAVAGARRLPRADAPALPKIPTLPISYGDAEPLLAALGGRVAPEEWRGALPLTYRIGPGPARVHLEVAFDWRLVPAYDVIGLIPGAVEPDRWVVRGNHHDAWTYGADDPLSGLAPMLEEARAFGVLLKSGWRPRRTIVYAAWDGEEPGLLGSVEWVEAHAEELARKVVLYVNSDTNARGFFGAQGSPSLTSFVDEALASVADPETSLSVRERGRLAEQAAAEGAEARAAVAARPRFRLPLPGAGSDQTAFAFHLGVPTLFLYYAGEGDDDAAAAHTRHDTFERFERFSDGALVYGRALAQTAGLLVLRAADRPSLPSRAEDLAAGIAREAAELRRFHEALRAGIADRRAAIAAGLFAAAADPNDKLPPARAEDFPPALDFAPLVDAAARLTCTAQSAAASPGTDEERNAAVAALERGLSDPAGLPRRPWYRSLLVAPATTNGYRSRAFPGVREAIEASRWDEARSELARVTAALVRAARLLAGGSAPAAKCGPS